MSLFDDPRVQLTPTGGAAAPSPITASQMPLFAPPPAAAPPPGLFGRLKARMSNNLFHTPSGLGDLVSPDEVSAARQQGLLSLGIALTQGGGENALQSLGRGLSAAQQGFQGALQNTVGQKEQQIQFAAQQAAAQKQKLHAQLAMKYAPVPNETPDQAVTRLSSYANEMASFDPDAASKLADTVSKLREPSSAPHTIPLGGHAVTIDRNGKVLRDDPITESAADRRAAANSARTQATADLREKNADIRNQNVVIHNFNNDKVVKDFHGAEAAYAVLNAARQNTSKNFMRPMASLDALARMLNPQGSVRSSTLQILKDQGGLGQKAERWVTMASKGEWPADMQQEVYDMADRIMQQHADDFDHFRQEAVDGASAQGLDPAVLEKIIYHRRQLNIPKRGSTGKLGSY